MTSSIPTGPHQPEKFWTSRRVTFTFVVLALLAALGATSCTQPENATTTDSGSTSTTNSSSGGGPAAATAPGNNEASSVRSNNTGAPTAAGGAPPTAMLTPLPAALMDAPLKTIDGKAFKISDSKGKVLLLDLWATWCGPCRQEVPHLVELQKELAGRGFEVIGLDIDPISDSVEDVQAFMKEFKVNYKVAFLERQYALTLMSENSSIPQSYIITRDGRIHSRFIGFSITSTPPKLRAAIEEALNTKG